jgi:hypothetical protein
MFNRIDRREDILSIVGTLDKLCTLDWFTSAAKNECTAAFGLKWMLNQVLQHCISLLYLSCFFTPDFRLIFYISFTYLLT